MAVISYEDVKASVGELYKAGKEFPQKEMFYAVPQDKRTAKAAEIMQDTIKSIADTFVKQKIGVTMWQRATEIAKVSAEKIITPYLMQNALTRAQQEYVSENVAEAQQEKQEEREMFMPDGINKMLWRWTKANLSEGRAIMPYMPDETVVTKYFLRLGMPRELQGKNRQLVRAHLNDCIYAKQMQSAVKSRLLVNKSNWELKLEVI